MEPAGVATITPSATSSGHAFALVDHDTQPRRLVGLAKQRHFVDGVMNVNRAVDVGGAHQQRMDHGFGRRREPRVQIVGGEFVHQKADGAAVHAVDRLSQRMCWCSVCSIRPSPPSATRTSASAGS